MSKIDFEDLEQFSEEFNSDRANVIAANSSVQLGILESAVDYKAARLLPDTFSINLEQGSITNQKSSGRCWLFSALNTFRYELIHNFNLADAELSQNYLFFYDKLEKANFFLEEILAHLDEPSDSRMLMTLMRGVRSDGGEWEMFVSLVKKYGLVPQSAQPETVSTDDSRAMAPVVVEKLREFARDLRRGHATGKTISELRAEKEDMLRTVYKMYCICYGEPVKTFDFKARSKKGEFICARNITPLEFFRTYVDVDLDEYVDLVCGSSGGSELKKFRFPDEGNVIGGKDVSYVSVPVKTLKRAAIAQLKDGEPVWFGCDVGERCWREGGILDDTLYGYESLFSTPFQMERRDRFDYRQASMSHAMTFKGVDLNVQGDPLWWRVENSWGEDAGKKGMFIMSDGWFEKYTYQVIIHRRYLPENILQVYDGDEVTDLKKWQPHI